MIRRDSFTGSRNGTVGYVRRSTDKQEQFIEDQKNAISAYIVENGLRFLRFYIDDAISGTSTLGRRAFQQMIKDAESSPRPFDIIAVYDTCHAPSGLLQLRQPTQLQNPQMKGTRNAQGKRL